MASRKKSKVVPWFSLKIVLDSTGWEMSLFCVLEKQFSLQKGWVWRDLKATFQSLQGDQQGRPGSFWQGLLGGQEPMDIMWIKRGWDFPHKDSQMLKQAVQTGLCTLCHWSFASPNWIKPWVIWSYLLDNPTWRKRLDCKPSEIPPNQKNPMISGYTFF